MLSSTGQCTAFHNIQKFQKTEQPPRGGGCKLLFLRPGSERTGHAMTTQVVVMSWENNSKHQTRKRNNNFFNKAKTMMNNVVCDFVVVSGNKQTKETKVNNST
jgi:hypothetical protein